MQGQVTRSGQVTLPQKNLQSRHTYNALDKVMKL